MSGLSCGGINYKMSSLNREISQKGSYHNILQNIENQNTKNIDKAETSLRYLELVFKKKQKFEQDIVELGSTYPGMAFKLKHNVSIVDSKELLDHLNAKYDGMFLQKNKEIVISEYEKQIINLKSSKSNIGKTVHEMISEQVQKCSELSIIIRNVEKLLDSIEASCSSSVSSNSNHSSRSSLASIHTDVEDGYNSDDSELLGGVFQWVNGDSDSDSECCIE